MAWDTARPSIQAVADPVQTPPDSRIARFIRLEKAVSLPSQQTLNLPGSAFGASNYMREILGYAPIQPDGSVVVQVPAQVAFAISVLDENGRRISSIHDSWLQVQPGETVKCNGCHTPASAQQPLPGMTALSHGRQGVFSSIYAGGTVGAAFQIRSRPTPGINGTEPLVPATQGETMAETLHDASCAGDSPRCLQDVPTRDVMYSDLWTNTAVATPGTPIAYTYQAINQGFRQFDQRLGRRPRIPGVWSSGRHLPHHDQLHPSRSSRCGPSRPAWSAPRTSPAHRAAATVPRPPTAR